MTTTAVAVPLSTLVPMKQMFLSSVGELSSFVSGSWNFSTGSDSPVRLPWLTKRSFEDSSRTSPGIMSPAASLTMSPGTKSRSGISLAAPSRTTVAVTWIMALSFSCGGIRPGFLPEAQSHTQRHHNRHHGCRRARRL